MATTGISSIDHEPQVVAEWLNELSDALGWSEKGRAYLLLRTVLHATRDQLGANEAADLASQFPMMIKGIFYDGWQPAKTPVEDRSKAAFLARVARAFSKEPLEDPDRAISAVFQLISNHVSEGEVAQVSGSMKKPLRELWPAGA